MSSSRASVFVSLIAAVYAAQGNDSAPPPSTGPAVPPAVRVSLPRPRVTLPQAPLWLPSREDNAPAPPVEPPPSPAPAPPTETPRPIKAPTTTVRDDPAGLADDVVRLAQRVERLEQQVANLTSKVNETRRGAVLPSPQSPPSFTTAPAPPVAYASASPVAYNYAVPVYTQPVAGWTYAGEVGTCAAGTCAYPAVDPSYGVYGVTTRPGLFGRLFGRR